MKSVLILVTLMSLAISCISASQSEGKEFITGFFQAVKGGDWKINENCFGQAFEAEIEDLKSSIKTLNLQKALEILSKIAVETQADCPVAEFKELKNLITEKVKSGELLSNIRKNFNQIILIIGELFHSQTQRPAYNYGKALGRIALIVLYNSKSDKALRFLALEKAEDANAQKNPKMNLDDFEIFYKGILTGVSKVPYEENKCYKEIPLELDQLLNQARKIYDSIREKSPSEFTTAIAELLVSLSKLKSYDENCKVNQLIKSLTTYSASYIGLAKLIYNIASNGKTYFNLTKDMYQAIKDKSYEKAGITTGKIMKTLLSWETN